MNKKIRILWIFALLLIIAGVIFQASNTIDKPKGLLCRKFIPTQSESAQAGYQDLSINFDPQKTAVVIIDVWNRGFLGDLVTHKISPLIKLARENKITILHAPSTPLEPYNLIPVKPEDILIRGNDNADSELLSRGIDTLLYVGYDALLCVLDKPCGIFQTRFRHPNFKIILVRDAVISARVEMKTVGVNIVETKFGCSTTLADLYSFFKTAPPQEIFYDVVSPHESSFDLKTSDTIFDSSETALVVVGASDNQPNEEWRSRVERNRSEKLVKLIEFARSNGIVVIHVPSKSGIADDCQPLPDEPVINSEEGFISIIKQKNIKNLLYAGYALNQDILYGPAGIARLYIQKRYKSNKIAKYYIVSDCVLAFETPATLSNETIKKTLLKYYRDVEVVTSDQLPAMIRG